MEDLKIGDKIKIINPKHEFFEKEGSVLKVNDRTVYIYLFEEDEKILIKKNFVQVLQVESPEWILIPSKGKKRKFEYYIKKAIHKDDFKEFLLFNYIRPIEYLTKKYTQEELLDIKIRKKELKSSRFNTCIYFTPIPKKFTAKYFSKELIEKYTDKNNSFYNKQKRYVFICLNDEVLCNLPKKFWIGVNFRWQWGPQNLLSTDEFRQAFFYIDSCKTTIDLNEKIFDFMMKQIMKELRDLKLFENDIGFSLNMVDENKFINFLRRKIFDSFAECEIFVCTKRWNSGQFVTLKFKDENLLIANYKEDTAKENIMRVLED